MRTAALILLMTWGHALLAQKSSQALIDSLEHALAARTADTGKVHLYVLLSRAFYTVDPRKGFPFADSGLALAQKLSYQRGIADVNNALGLLAGDTGNNAIARVYFDKSLAINKTLDATPNIIANLNNLGRSYERESDFAKASGYYFQGLALAESTGNKEQAALLGTNITSLFIQQNDLKKAADYANRTIKDGKEAHALNHVAKAYELLGAIYLQSNDTPDAKKNFDSAMAIDRVIGNQMAIVSVLGNMGTAEADPEKAIPIFLEAEAILDSLAPASQTAIGNLANLGLNYYAFCINKKGAEREHALRLAAAYLARADSISQITKTFTFEPDIQQGVSNVLEAKGDYKGALTHFKRFTTLNDSLFSQDSKNQIAHLESQRSIDLKNKEIENRELLIANQQKTLWLLIVGLGLLAAMGAILYRETVIRKRTNDTLQRLNAELNEANKIKAKFFGILSHDLRSPIARLLNFLQLQQKKPDSLNAAEKAEYWEKIGSSAAVLLETMETMLLWSKGQMEYFKPRVRAVQVTDLFTRLGQLYQDTDHIALGFHCEDGLTVDTDEDYLWTILQNLTSNAVRALQQTSGARIDWRGWREGRIVYCSITDNGPGVSEEQLKALYDESVGTSARQGLGLHIIRDLAKAIGCVITPRPAADGGTVFILELNEG